MIPLEAAQVMLNHNTKTMFRMVGILQKIAALRTHSASCLHAHAGL